MTDYDSLWKEALELYFPAFLALFRPRIHADIDWSRGHNFLDKELERILPKADRYNRTVVSLAVLADDDPDWRPDHYQEELWDWSVPMGWLPVKLLDYADRVAEWERSQNLFAPVVLVHLKALETRHDPTNPTLPFSNSRRFAIIYISSFSTPPYPHRPHFRGANHERANHHQSDPRNPRSPAQRHLRQRQSVRPRQSLRAQNRRLPRRPDGSRH